MTYALFLYTIGNYNEAPAATREAEEFNPDSEVPRELRCAVFGRQGKYDLAIPLCEEAAKPLPNADTLSYLGFVYAEAGRTANASKVLGDLLELRRSGHGSPTAIASVYIGLRDFDQAFAWLDTAFEEHDLALRNNVLEPQFESLRADPRYALLMQRLKLPPP